MENATTTKSEVDLNAIVIAAREKAQKQQGKEFASFDAPDLPRYKGHEHFLTLAFSHIFANALRYGSEPPSLTIEFSSTNADYLISVSNHLAKDFEKTERLFLPFTRGENGSRDGSGIGLNIAQRVFEDLHGGSLKVDSEMNGYFTLRIGLPRAKASNRRSNAKRARNH